MKVLVTGADGFAGRYLVRHLLAAGHRVVGAVRSGERGADAWLTSTEREAIRWTALELDGTASLAPLFDEPFDAVVHLAAVASSGEARKDPMTAWTVNALGTARLVAAAAQARDEGRGDPAVLVVSSSEVYGPGPAGRLRTETDPVQPVSPYGATKAAAEIAALEGWRRTGLRVMLARAFQHTGPGQTQTYVVPALARRLTVAKRRGAVAINTGNLEPVRDIADVRDVVAAYAALIARGQPGETYNVCTGIGIRLYELFERLAAMLECRVMAEPDAALLRAGDIAHLVGDPSKLKAATGWSPVYTLDQTLRDVLDAQAD